MNSPATFKKSAQREATNRPSDALTHVELIWFEKRTEYWIRFGQQAGERVIDRRRRVVSFAPGQVFAFVRWASNDYGTVLSCIDILRAACRGEPYQTVPSVQPGGDVLLAINGWPKVERVLQIIDAIEASGIDPVDVAPDHWRHVSNRLAAHQTPRTYTQTRHAAWIRRRRVGR
tara:strand:+ start:85 stop:606 length:522 start_codon:yes stop_codon:yes gene_type:complete